MSRVIFKGKIVSSGAFEADIESKPKCFACGDSGYMRETIDDDRLDEMMPCWNCRAYCKVCNRWRKKEHECQTS